MRPINDPRLIRLSRMALVVEPIGTFTGDGFCGDSMNGSVRNVGVHGCLTYHRVSCGPGRQLHAWYRFYEFSPAASRHTSACELHPRVRQRYGSLSHETALPCRRTTNRDTRPFSPRSNTKRTWAFGRSKIAGARAVNNSSCPCGVTILSDELAATTRNVCPLGVR